jgi:hypothetical protein
MALKLGVSGELVNKIYIAALLHDIGKAVPSFQSYMKTCTDPSALLIVDDDYQDPISADLFPLHHEIGWAYLTTKMSEKYILNAVYWHHARPIHSVNKKRETFDTADEVLTSMGDADRDALDKLWNLLLPMFQYSLVPSTGNINVPDLFEKDTGSCNRNDNAEFMLVRACVISADRHVSSLSVSAVESLSIDAILASAEIEGLLSGNIQGQPVKPADYEQGRYDLQVGVVKSVGDALTAIVKAPAGLGKTLIGILWAKAQGGKTVWVCPRNAVADAVYENIDREVKALGLSCTIELYRTGAVQKTNVEGRPEFSSDIVVTNIDAVMSPMVNNGIAGRLFTTFGSNIVLDEFHEFVSDAPLFAAFVTYMRARHRVSSTSRTLLLSATPSLIQLLWDTTDKPTLILPDGDTHYPAAHQGVYQIDFADDFPSTVTPGSLLVCNSVSESQNNFGLGYTHIIHHRYTEQDRKTIEGNIFSSFGKYKLGVSKGESLSAALVVQAAMDISFLHLFDSVCSPESSLQRIGRTDRWGTFQAQNPKITFLSLGYKKTEAGAIRTVYSKDLQALWITFLKQELSGISTINLAGLYKIYNKFYQVNGKEIKDFIVEQYGNGMNGPRKGMEFIGLVGFAPIKVLNTDPNTKKKSSNKNLRSPDGSYFYTVEVVGQPNTWLKPDSVLSEGYELYDRYNGSGPRTAGLINAGTMMTRLKGLVACGYDAWTKQSKGKAKVPDNLKDWFKKARNPETPLPDFSREYDLKLGVINKPLQGSL